MLNVELMRPLFRTAWGPDTCDPHDLASWRPDNPARGQCATTALVVQDLLGGELVMGEVHVDGVKVGHHWWNRLLDGTTVDLTADQFHPGETVLGGQIRHRPPEAPRRCRGQYELLRYRVLGALVGQHPELAGQGPLRGRSAASPARPAGPPVRIAVVALTDPTGAVLLQLRRMDKAAEPGQWGLAGGHVEAGESPAEAAARELAEETGLTAKLRPVWRDMRPDLTGSAPAVDLHAFTGMTTQTTITLGEGEAARFVAMQELPDLDLSPTAAAVLHRLLRLGIEPQRPAAENCNRNY
jgi:8-oxo-dGTP pyrophosphatase MutT (NUDIX family)